MAGYDKNLDKQLFAQSVELDKGKITVSVFAYNEGTPKLQITRENKTAAGEYQFAKLGRMSKEELEAIMPLIEKAKAKL